MTEEKIKELCPQADRVFVTQDYGGIIIGLKVGDFSQSIGVTFEKNPGTAERKVKDMYLDLLAMNREQQKQEAEARRILNEQSSR